MSKHGKAEPLPAGIVADVGSRTVTIELEDGEQVEGESDTASC